MSPDLKARVEALIVEWDGKRYGDQTLRLRAEATVALLRDVLALLPAEAPPEEPTLRPNRYDCAECGKGIAVDEDECCRSCGEDAERVLETPVDLMQCLREALEKANTTKAAEAPRPQETDRASEADKCKCGHVRVLHQTTVLLPYGPCDGCLCKAFVSSQESPQATVPSSLREREPISDEEALALVQTMDGRKWADAFCRTTGFPDEDWALTWFCNAIMAGYDEAQRRSAAALDASAKEIERLKGELADALEAKSELGYIKALMSDRSEPGTYAKVAAQAAEIETLKARAVAAEERKA